MTKADDVLLELNRKFAAYMKSVFPFQYEGKVYQLINNYVASPHMRCDVCGNYPLIEVSIIRSEDCQQLHVGNNCIDRLTNRQVSRWFKNYRKKRENVIRNRKYIDGLSLILNASRRNEPAFQINDSDIKKLSLVLEKMVNGLNPDRREEQIAECYMRRIK
ncbi:hypothetical protein JXA31_05350 [Candidatus Bathyarchaeota archaeon]|nr:hypothetical protein [Candidatus Bathyarchaeota archaeon]